MMCKRQDFQNNQYLIPQVYFFIFLEGLGGGEETLILLLHTQVCKPEGKKEVRYKCCYERENGSIALSTLTERELFESCEENN